MGQIPRLFRLEAPVLSCGHPELLNDCLNKESDSRSNLGVVGKEVWGKVDLSFEALRNQWCADWQGTFDMDNEGSPSCCAIQLRSLGNQQSSDKLTR